MVLHASNSALQRCTFFDKLAYRREDWFYRECILTVTLLKLAQIFTVVCSLGLGGGSVLWIVWYFEMECSIRLRMLVEKQKTITIELV